MEARTYQALLGAEDIVRAQYRERSCVSGQAVVAAGRGHKQTPIKLAGSRDAPTKGGGKERCADAAALAWNGACPAYRLL